MTPKPAQEILDGRRKERISEAVARLGDFWWSSQYLPRGVRISRDEYRLLERPHIMDNWVMWQRTLRHYTMHPTKNEFIKKP